MGNRRTGGGVSLLFLPGMGSQANKHHHIKKSKAARPKLASSQACAYIKRSRAQAHIKRTSPQAQKTIKAASFPYIYKGGRG